MTTGAFAGLGDRGLFGEILLQEVGVASFETYASDKLLVALHRFLVDTTGAGFTRYRKIGLNAFGGFEEGFVPERTSRTESGPGRFALVQMKPDLLRFKDLLPERPAKIFAFPSA
ncbi:MAG: hypothetical protein JW727_04005 [Candidatus Aenigmarchaeota archaeon]|nr:hypothetical protein [Candidatus Aenigmarchaeota archaeon]